MSNFIENIATTENSTTYCYYTDITPIPTGDCYTFTQTSYENTIDNNSLDVSSFNKNTPSGGTSETPSEGTGGTTSGGSRTLGYSYIPLDTSSTSSNSLMNTYHSIDDTLEQLSLGISNSTNTIVSNIHASLDLRQAEIQASMDARVAENRQVVAPPISEINNYAYNKSLEAFDKSGDTRKQAYMDLWINGDTNHDKTLTRSELQAFMHWDDNTLNSAVPNGSIGPKELTEAMVAGGWTLIPWEVSTPPPPPPPAPVRTPAPEGFNEALYLEANPDVANAVAAGTVLSAYDHYLMAGMAEGRSLTPAPEPTPALNLTYPDRVTNVIDVEKILSDQNIPSEVLSEGPQAVAAYKTQVLADTLHNQIYDKDGNYRENPPFDDVDAVQTIMNAAAQFSYETTNTTIKPESENNQAAWNYRFVTAIMEPANDFGDWGWHKSFQDGTSSQSGHFLIGLQASTVFEKIFGSANDLVMQIGAHFHEMTGEGNTQEDLNNSYFAANMGNLLADGKITPAQVGDLWAAQTREGAVIPYSAFYLPHADLSKRGYPDFVYDKHDTKSQTYWPDHYIGSILKAVAPIMSSTMGLAVDIGLSIVERYIAPYFNETVYLAANPDVAAAIEAGTLKSGAEHFLKYGFTEGREADVTKGYEEAAYLAANPDVAAAVKAGTFKSGYDHLVQFGITEGREADVTKGYEESAYLAANPDVAAAVKDGTFKSGYDHLVQFGIAEGREANVTKGYDETAYLAANPDVAAAVKAGTFKSGYDHLVQFGIAEGREADPATSTATTAAADNATTSTATTAATDNAKTSTTVSNNSATFNEAAYLAANPDVAEAVNSGTMTAVEHYTLFGAAEGRDPSGN